MTQKAISVIILHLFFLIDINAQANKIVVLNKTNSTINSYYINDIFLGNPLNTLSNEKIEIKTDMPVWFIIADDAQFFYEAFPNDTLIILKQKGKIIVTPNFKGKGLNDIFSRFFFSERFLRKSIFKKSVYSKYTSLKIRDSVIEKKYYENCLFLKSIENEYLPIYIERFSTILQTSKILEKLNVYDPYIKINDLKYFYRDSLSNYCKFLNLQNRTPFNIFSDELATTLLDFFVLDNSNIFETADKYFTDDFRDFLITRTLIKRIRNSSISKKVCDSIIARFDIKNDMAIKREIIEREEMKKFTSTNKTFLTTNNNGIDFKDIVDTNKGNILYFDIWASWCKPCMEEMKFSKELSTIYKNKKIKFMYISMDNSKSAWTNYISKNNFLNNTKNSFLSINNFSSQLAKQLRITTIPRYILIGKDGKIITANAPRPSDPKLKTLLDNYINQ